MRMVLRGIEIENFKSYSEKQYVHLSDLSVLLGANSSGKSTALQALLVLKQTFECNSPDEELLLSGKYVSLGDFEDVISDKKKDYFSFAVELEQKEITEIEDKNEIFRIAWKFVKAEDGSSASLKRLDVVYGALKVTFDKDQDGSYHMYVDDERYPFSVNIKDLIISGYSIYYDKELNSKFAELLNQLSKILISRKTTTIAMDELVDGKVVRDFYMRLLSMEENDCANNSKDINDKAIKINKLIISYRELLSARYEEIINGLTEGLQVKILEYAMMHAENLANLDEIISVHENNIYESKLKKHDIDKYKGKHQFEYNPFARFNKDNGKEENLTQLQYSLDFYEFFLNGILSKVFFVGPIREMPKGLYNIGFETIPKYVGPTGAYFASVLLHENKKEREYILPRGKKEKCTLSDALSKWMMHLNIASSVYVDKKTSFGFSVLVENMEQITSEIMNVGIGTSQILPVLISVLLSEPDEILMFEQPELHLHPYSQSRLADMFAEFCKNGRKIVLETHSEYFILRLRYHIVSESFPNDSVIVNFFRNKGGTKITVANISGFGNIDYPEDFRDETQDLLNKILDASLKRKGLS